MSKNIKLKINNDGIKEVATKYAKVFYNAIQLSYSNFHSKHSAITLEDPAWLISKWGSTWFAKHRLRQCPYDYTDPINPSWSMHTESFVVYIRAAKFTKYNINTNPHNGNTINSPLVLIAGK